MNPTVCDRITKTPGVCGGEVPRGTRLPSGGSSSGSVTATDAELRQLFRPPLTQEDLDAAWAYARAHPDEIERALWFNEAVMLEQTGVDVLADFIRQGRRLGLTDAEVRDAFEPPLTQQALDHIARHTRQKRTGGNHRDRSAFLVSRKQFVVS